MPRWDKRCEDGHVHEYSGTYKEHETAKEAGIPCPECGKPTETVISFGRYGGGIVYKCAGFYGNVPTQDAHWSGNM